MFLCVSFLLFHSVSAVTCSLTLSFLSAGGSIYQIAHPCRYLLWGLVTVSMISFHRMKFNSEISFLLFSSFLFLMFAKFFILFDSEIVQKYDNFLNSQSTPQCTHAISLFTYQFLLPFHQKTIFYEVRMTVE